MAPMTYAYNACYTAALRPDTPRRQSLRGATSDMRFHPRHGAVVLASFAGYIYTLVTVSHQQSHRETVINSTVRAKLASSRS